MHWFEVALILLLFATLAVALAPRLKLPTEVLLLFGSLLISFIPDLPSVTLQPDVVFLVFLPPILFAAAYFTSWRDFKANLRPISLLAIGLVISTSCTVAIVARTLIPGFSWGHSFLLGAIVSPSDASSAAAIIRKLGVPRRLVTIIEGESLVNDATALVVYRFALAAVMTGAFSFSEAVGRFLWVVVVGGVVGLIVCLLSVELVKRVKDSHASTILTLLTSFACYTLAERVGASGVISTVAGGIYMSRQFPRTATAKARVEARAVWDVAIFVINGFVFTLIGLQLPKVLRGLGTYSLREVAGYAIAVSLTVIVTRMIWVFPEAYVPRLISPSLRARDPYPSWQQLVVLGWTGMRGIVSLAAALALPQALPSAEFIPQRNLLVFLTYAVIVVTLAGPSLSLPLLMRWLRLKDGDEAFREEAHARVAATQAVLTRIEKWSRESTYPAELIQQFRDRFERRLRTIQSNLRAEPFSELCEEDLSIRRMTHEAIQTERGALLELRRKGAVHDDIFHRISDELDLEDLRLKTQRI